MIDMPKPSRRPDTPPRKERRMIDVKKLRKLKGRRIYLFWLDEKTGDITDVTSRDDVIQVIRCKDCKYHFYDGKDEVPYCVNLGYYGNGWKDDDFCSYAERKEE